MVYCDSFFTNTALITRLSKIGKHILKSPVTHKACDM